jgi:hypothetical protein
MLTRLQQKDVWDGWLGSEMRSNYFADLAGRYQRTQNLITWGILVMSSGTFATLLADWVPPQYKWVRPVLAFLAGALSLRSILAKNERKAIDCSDLFFQWGSLAQEFKNVWDNMYDKSAPEKLQSSQAKTLELSRRCTNLPNKEALLLKWENHKRTVLGRTAILRRPYGEFAKYRLLCVRQVATCADHIYRFVAIICANLFHDAAHMILHCELRQIQVCRNLFIAHTPCDKIHQFELPVGQQTLCTTLLAGNLCPLPIFARQMLNESHAEFWRAGGLSLCHPPDGGDYFRG